MQRTAPATGFARRVQLHRDIRYKQDAGRLAPQRSGDAAVGFGRRLRPDRRVEEAAEVRREIAVRRVAEEQPLRQFAAGRIDRHGHAPRAATARSPDATSANTSLRQFT